MSQASIQWETINDMATELATFFGVPLKLHLAKNAPTLKPFQPPADFDECDFSGYAAVSIEAANTPVWDSTINGMLVSLPTITFATTGTPPATGNDVLSWYITDSTGAHVYSAGIFADPVSMQNFEDHLVFNVIWTVQNLPLIYVIVNGVAN